MSTKELLLNEIEHFPEPLLDEVLDFMNFLKAKSVQERLEATVISESSLKKDWLKPEEDKAWQNL
ncbi:MAG: DUF2281 domain-containing protein [Deltaproteobacteria bacterium]|jgi:hypothetical protein|nr:DUF2281 domain-containing protein [Deltaproteobacteria bacterium]MCL5879251.1 DUF2281 domain-containing protein [Deltaproteobacteria bacterium]MDA8304966.1 DUF2281 domain-containing protein [Deltaproteobacteria bacterium]